MLVYPAGRPQYQYSQLPTRNLGRGVTIRRLWGCAWPPGRHEVQRYCRTSHLAGGLTSAYNGRATKVCGSPAKSSNAVHAVLNGLAIGVPVYHTYGEMSPAGLQHNARTLTSNLPRARKLLRTRKT